MPTRFAFLRTTFLCLMLIVMCVPAFAQQAASKTASQSTGKSTNQTASQTPANITSSKAKGSKETTCDGGLEIVPRKQVTFVRKRRPADAPPAPTTPADAKPAKKSSNEISQTSSSQ